MRSISRPPQDQSRMVSTQCSVPLVILLAMVTTTSSFQPSGLRSNFSLKHSFDRESRFHPIMTRRMEVQQICLRLPVLHQAPNDEELERMREEIDNLRKEALERMDTLSGRVGVGDQETTMTATITSPSVVTSVDKDTVTSAGTDPRSARVSNNVFTEIDGIAEVDPLDGTHWKIMLNIGREAGTWMPKTWGVSGERLYLNLEVCFGNQKLYNRLDFLNGVGEDFLGGTDDAKVCRVVRHELSLSPSMTEGTRKVKLRDGGWRVARGEGPMGTDLLRFYIESDEEIRHQGGDVYTPAGRIYCTCGYFAMNRPSGIKDDLRTELGDLDAKYNRLSDKLENENMFSLKRVTITKDMFDTTYAAQDVKRKLKNASITEPDKSLLRVSKRGDVGITREGGVCCKVLKGLSNEYHILGKFSLAAVDPKREVKEDVRP